MKTKERFNKGMALVLSAALVLGLAPAIPGNVYNRVLADGAATSDGNTDGGTATAPSVEVYADIDTLLSDTFTPGAEDAKVAKLKLGRYKNKSFEWYILGPDGNIDGNKSNIAIFAQDSIYWWFDDMPGLVWYGGQRDNPYKGDEDEKYVHGSTPTTVSGNHYGESGLRDILRQMAGEEDGDETNAFTAAEQAMMQKTTVLTHDRDDTSQLYTTSDKLYVPSAKAKGDTDIYVGNMSEPASLDDIDVSYECTGIKLPMETYWSHIVRPTKQEDTEYSGFSELWLRTPKDGDTDFLLTGLCRSYSITNRDLDGQIIDERVVEAGVSTGVYIDLRRLRPASNLNLENVKFASAAPAATSAAGVGGVIVTNDEFSEPDDDGYVTYIQKQWAMTLRLDGSDKGIGNFAYDKNGITAKKGSTSSDVSLIVQGKNGDTDWYYSKQISGTETVTIDNIVAAVNADAEVISADDIQLNNCKIWLEIPYVEADGTTVVNSLSYAGVSHVHNNTDKWEYDANEHYHVCTEADCPNNGRVDAAAHTYDDNYVCTVCGYDQKHVHYPLSRHDAKDPTATEDGNKTYWECDTCHKKYWDQFGFVEITDDSWRIPATGSKSTSSSTTYSDGSTKNSDRYSGGSGRGSSGGSSGGSGMTYLSGSAGTTTGWSKDSSGKWWYYDAAYGKILGWVYDKSTDKWYYVDENNGRLYGWFYDTEASYWYYLDLTTGEMLTGWQPIGGKQYYFAPKPPRTTYSFNTSSRRWYYDNPEAYRSYGSMYINTTTPDNHSVDANGAKIQ